MPYTVVTNADESSCEAAISTHGSGQWVKARQWRAPPPVYGYGLVNDSKLMT
jgi:hypothetical protein